MSDLGPAENVRGIAQLSDAALEHIRKPAKSGTLLAYYSDHLELPLGPKHRFPDTKYAKNREQLMADPELQGLIEYREVTCGQHLMAPERWCQTREAGRPSVVLTASQRTPGSFCSRASAAVFFLLPPCGGLLMPGPVTSPASLHHSLPPICPPALLASTCLL